jgi:hypothetical protein
MVLIRKNYNEVEFINPNALTILHPFGPPPNLLSPIG